MDPNQTTRTHTGYFDPANGGTVQWYPANVTPAIPLVEVVYEVRNYENLEEGDEPEILHLVDVARVPYEDMHKVMAMAEHLIMTGNYLSINGNQVQVVDFEFNVDNGGLDFIHICQLVKPIDPAIMAAEVDAAMRFQSGKSYDA